MRDSKLKNLNAEPLSVAKYFYKKGFEDYRLTQDFLYLTYLEALKKRTILCQEKFEAWKSGPVIKSVVKKMHDYYQKNQELAGLFNKVKDIHDQEIKELVKKVYRKYQISKKKGQEIEFFFQVQDEPWEQTRQNFDSGKQPSPTMEVDNIISLTN